MITLSKELIKNIVEFNNLQDYLAVVVDLPKETELSNKFNELTKQLEEIGLDDSFAIHKVMKYFDKYEENLEERYIYHVDEVADILFPDSLKKNRLLQSAFNWIPYNNQLDWIVLNVLCEKEHYNKVEKLNIDYLMTTEELHKLYK